VRSITNTIITKCIVENVLAKILINRFIAKMSITAMVSPNCPIPWHKLFLSLRDFGHLLLWHFGLWNISVICLTVVLQIAICTTVF